MIEKNEQPDDDNTRVGIISERKKLLQDTSAKVRSLAYVGDSKFLFFIFDTNFIVLFCNFCSF